MKINFIQLKSAGENADRRTVSQVSQRTNHEPFQFRARLAPSSLFRVGGILGSFGKDDEDGGDLTRPQSSSCCSRQRATHLALLFFGTHLSLSCISCMKTTGDESGRGRALFKNEIIFYL